MIRNYIIAEYIKLGSKVRVFGHHASIHFKIMKKVLLAFLLLRILSLIVIYLRGNQEAIKRILSGCVLFVYAYFLLEFLNNYLDSLISNDRGITIFRRDGLLQYSVQQFERSSIEMISFKQESFSDRLWDKGNIIINLEQGISFHIENMANPQKVVNILRSQKGEFGPKTLPQHDELFLEDNNNDKFEILVETLGEVIKDYMDKGSKEKPKLE